VENEQIPIPKKAKNVTPPRQHVKTIAKML
jgi:hypothetical protein